ncbi:hypothetical protein FZEAL_594 [Fusarium zealandicum]|uniref:Uncharacterized protein n=1 Tax=Fusarium zealandicum TaxID=1053134 RepID=A0A8H4UUV9_9HYPO|nr:hypothetical protein FZEAL_594 [Fusarium zealandicum]
MDGAPYVSNIPPPAVRKDITNRLGELVLALEAHPEWTPPSPPRGLYHVWDFVCRSRYIMGELDNISAGRPTQHPEQIPKNDGATSGPQAAALSFNDVCTRSITVDEMIQNSRMLVMLGLPNTNFGDAVKEKSSAVRKAITESKLE